MANGLASYDGKGGNNYGSSFAWQNPQQQSLIPQIQTPQVSFQDFGKMQMQKGGGLVGMNENQNGMNVGMSPKPESGFNFSEGMQNFSLGAQGVLGLASAYQAYQQQKLMKKQFNASMGFNNRNLANSAATTNLSLANQNNVASQLMTGAELGSATQQQYERDNLVQVDGSPIKV